MNVTAINNVPRWKWIIGIALSTMFSVWIAHALSFFNPLAEKTTQSISLLHDSTNKETLYELKKHQNYQLMRIKML